MTAIVRHLKGFLNLENHFRNFIILPGHISYSIPKLNVNECNCNNLSTNITWKCLLVERYCLRNSIVLQGNNQLQHTHKSINYFLTTFRITHCVNVTICLPTRGRAKSFEQNLFGAKTSPNFSKSQPFYNKEEW